jgi:hypothetical protein
VWTADAYEFDFSPAAPRFFLTKGWWPPEWAGPIGMAWAGGGESTLAFFLPDARAITMELRLSPLPSPKAPPQTVSVTVNGHGLGRLALGREWTWRTYSLDIPARALRPGVNTARFSYAYSMVPRDIIPGNPDSRDLAVAFNRIALRRAPHVP